MRKHTLPFLLLPLLPFCAFLFVPCATELVSLTVGVGAFSALSLFIGDFGGFYTRTKCKFYECCDRPWINRDGALRLEPDVEQHLYGQHIAQNTVTKALRAHLAKAAIFVLFLHLFMNPNKALVMSFHGWTGTGKNYLAKMIAKAIYKKEMRSQFVHQYVATHHFPNAEETDKYKEQLRVWIRTNLTNCERSLFIFDEMDKMPIQLLDAIVPFIDFYDHLNGIDARKSVFLFLSNGGANSIAQRALEYYNRGEPREAIALREMEEIIQISAYNEGDGGLKSSRLIKKHLIDYFVPFLPLERKHVVMCFKDYLRSLNVNYTPEQLERLTDSISYFPRETPIYASAGCKQVVQRTDFMMDDLIRESRPMLSHFSDEL